MLTSLQKRILALAVLVTAALAAAAWLGLLRPNSHPAAGAREAVPAQFTDRNFFLTAIKRSRVRPLPEAVTGITVPHHLLARDVMADVFAAAAGRSYGRVIIISPDHFSLGASKISFATRDFNTVFGPLPADSEFISRLAKVREAEPADFFYREHGIGAELPFVKYFFPNAKLVAVALSIYAKPEDVAGLVDFLKRNIDSRTLLVQSTDFSHYLPASEADQKDRQTMQVLDNIDQGADPQSIYGLTEPDNLDCLACQYVQSSIQSEFFKSRLHIFDHKNSQDYATEPVAETTSYIPQIYY